MNSDVISESTNIDLLAKACLIGFGFQDLDQPPSVGRPILFLSLISWYIESSEVASSFGAAGG
jgi:hypothetical protein